MSALPQSRHRLRSACLLWGNTDSRIAAKLNLYYLVLEPHAGRAECRFRKKARARERHRHRPVDSLKALDPKRPIREADMCGALAHVCFGPKADIQNDYERSGSNAATRGKITLISVNSPCCVSTSIEPPCCFTMMS